ncbi:MAG: hypothetical protein ACH350_09310, partial [Parachlamydiaceae bacterium]
AVLIRTNTFWIVVAMPGTTSVQQSVLYVNYVRENGQELKVIFDKWYKFLAKQFLNHLRYISFSHFTTAT